MGDADLEAIRAKRMAELQAQYGVTVIFFFPVMTHSPYLVSRLVMVMEISKKQRKTERLK